MKRQIMNNLRKEKIPFTQVVNELLNDPRITLKAKGIYAFMYSKPDNWKFTIKSMSKQLKEGDTLIGNSLNELKKFGWITYSKLKDGTGIYNIKIKPKPENPNLGFCNMPKSKRISNKESISNTYQSNTKSLYPSKTTRYNSGKDRLGEGY